MLKLQVFFMPLVAALGLLILSCNDETAINKVLGVSAEAPVFTGYRVISGTQIDFSFSEPVKAISAYFDPPQNVAAILNGDGGETAASTISINLQNDVSGGMRLTADILVEDDSGNTLNVLVPFRSRNDHVPNFVINEIRLVAAKPKAEFIEIKTTSAGNLGALRVFAASTSMDDPIYEFPPVEVRAGEYIILHLRTYPGQENCKDELGDNLALASITGTASERADAPTNARDLWSPLNQKFLHNSDVVYFVDQDDKIIDAVMFSDDRQSWEKNSALAKAAELLAKQAAWLDASGVQVKTPAFFDAASSTATTATRSLNRDKTRQDSNTAADWYICASSGASPGAENKP